MAGGPMARAMLRAMRSPVGMVLCGALLAACSASGPSLQSGPTLPAPFAAPPEPQQNDRTKPVKVALLVPLSAHGPSGIVGKSLKQAAELALFERDNPSLQLVVKDDKSTPDGARAAAD